MSNINVSVPDSLMSAVAERAKSCGYTDVSEFVSKLVRNVLERQDELERLAIEGLESGPSVPWDSKEIDLIRSNLKSRFSD